MTVRLALATLCAMALAVAGGTGMADASADARARFLAPPNSSRMLKIVHGWPAEETAIRGVLDGVANQGYGGVVTNVDMGGGYTDSDANWAKFIAATTELRNRRMAAWLYDEAGYPSGRAGTLVLQGRPELEARGLMIVHREVGEGPVEIEAPTGTPLLAEAYPVVRGSLVLDRRVRLEADNRKVRWNAPRGTWHIVLISVDRLYDGTQIACSGYPERTAYVGLMEPGLTDRFMALTHDRYTSRLGDDLRRTFTATFTDEPSTMAIYFNRMPWATLPWCSDFLEQFRQRRGYDLAPELACLVAEAGDRGRKVRADFYRTVSDLMVERWWEPLRRWSAANGVPSGGHLLLEENILHHVPLYGSAFDAFRHMDSPGIDCLSSDPSVPRYTNMAGMGADIPWNAARLASSVAELEDKAHVMCEVSEHIQNSGGAASKLSPAQYRGTWARLILGGINVLTSYHSFPEWTNDQIRAANDWIGRCLEATKGGRRAASVAVVYPTETVWTRFTPSDLWVEQASPDCSRIEKTLRDLSEALYRSRREFDYIDGQTLAEASVRAGELVHKDHRWRAVVLPVCDTLPERAWRNLAALHRAGGTVVLLGERPRHCLEHFPCRAAKSASRALTGGTRKAPMLEAAQGSSVPAVLDAVLTPDFSADLAAPVRMTRRRIGAEDVWFVLNDSGSPWSGKVSVPAEGRLEVWNPEDGTIKAEARNDVALELAPYGVVILRAMREAP